MRVYFTILSLFVAALSASARRAVEAKWIDSTSVRLVFVLAEDGTVGSDYAVTSVPTLTNGSGDTLRLSPTVFRGRRNLRYAERQRY